jgi:hypothetical protein
MKYNVYRKSDITNECRLIAEFQPGASDDSCNFGGVKFWSKENGFLKGQFKICEYWIISECEQKMLEEIAQLNGDDEE